jgi:hypothetical protein
MTRSNTGSQLFSDCLPVETLSMDEIARRVPRNGGCTAMPLPSTASWRSGLTRYVMACLPFKDGLPQEWGEFMPDVASRVICAIERGKTIKFL